MFGCFVSSTKKKLDFSWKKAGCLNIKEQEGADVSPRNTHTLLQSITAPEAHFQFKGKAAASREQTVPSDRCD